MKTVTLPATSQAVMKRLQSTKVSIPEIAKASGVSKTTIYDLLKGASKEPRYNTVVSIMTNLNRLELREAAIGKIKRRFEK